MGKKGKPEIFVKIIIIPPSRVRSLSIVISSSFLMTKTKITNKKCKQSNGINLNCFNDF